MSKYHIPSYIQEEIMKRLPVKSLVQYRCVSKAWKSLIDSSDFIATHSLHRHTQQQHLLVSYEDPMTEKNYVCYIDDDTFPKKRSLPALPQSIKQLFRPVVVGNSHGLLCLHGYDTDFKTSIVVLWNMSIRKSITVVLPRSEFIGFGVCPVTNDPKIVSITQSWDDKNIETSYCCKVLVYALSSGNWKSLSTSSNLPTKPFRVGWFPVVTDRFIYWIDKQVDNMIMSFDVTNECFEVIDLPDSFAHCKRGILHVSKVRDSLAMIHDDLRENIYTVWMMEHGVQISFTKLVTIKIPQHIRGSLVGFSKSGVPIMQFIHNGDYHWDLSKLFVYEPNSEDVNVLETSTEYYIFNLNSYTETLLLLERSDCISY